MFVRPGTYQLVKGLKAASLGWALTLLANFKLGWKGLSGTKTPLKKAYLSQLFKFIAEDFN
jgi:hypothetical protein